ncbi:Aspartic peptidase, partial [Parasponia andersonii]
HMASYFHFILFCCSLLISIIISPSIAKTTSFQLPKALVLPVTKDISTSKIQYTTQLHQRTPLVPVRLSLDLSGESLWVDCDKGYVSSTFKHPPCPSAECKLARFVACRGQCCSVNNTCSHFVENNFVALGTSGEVSQDIVLIQSTNGFNPGKPVSVPDVLFVCGYTFLLEGLPSGVTGGLGLGRRKIGLPSQLAKALGFRRKFAVCLSSSTRAKGVVFFGDGPYVMLPNIDVSKDLIYTPLIVNPYSVEGSFFKDPSEEYFVGVKSIKINNKAVRGFNTSELSISKEGFGGTKISTAYPYTVLRTSVYKPFVSAFAKALDKVPREEAVASFELCYSSKNIASTRVGPAVPQIDLVLKSKKGAVWSIFGANSMVQVNNDVLCLGFVDGGPFLRESIIIGGHQIEDNLLQFDLATSKLGFSSSLLFRQTTCSNFNFTSIAY